MQIINEDAEKMILAGENPDELAEHAIEAVALFGSRKLLHAGL